METAPGIDIKAQFKELSQTAMAAFCEDISGMFGMEMVSRQQDGCTETIAGLKKRFKTITAIITATAKGHLDGQFHLIFDQDGLFTLAGTIVMQPKQKILENKKRGSMAEAENIRDAIQEGGNMLVGSWNRLCMEKWGNKTHLLQTGTFIGNPWNSPKESLNAAENEEFLYIPCEMVIGDYPAFNYGILFTKSIMDSLLNGGAIKADSVTIEQPKQPSAPEAALQEKPVPAQPAAASAEVKPIPVKDPQPVVTPAETTKEADERSEENPLRTKLSAMALQVSQEGPEILWMLSAKDIMQKNIVWCQTDESVEQVRMKMNQNDIGYVIVGTNGMMEGLVSRSDLAAAMSPYLRPMFAQWRRPLDEASLQIKVKWVMSRPVHIVKPDKPLAIVMETMCRYGVRALPVVDQHGKVEGLITVFDIFKTLLQKKEDVLFAAKTA